MSADLRPLQAAAHYVTQPEIWPAFLVWLREERGPSDGTDEELWNDVADAHRTLTEIIDRASAGQVVMVRMHSSG